MKIVGTKTEENVTLEVSPFDLYTTIEEVFYKEYPEHEWNYIGGDGKWNYYTGTSPHTGKAEYRIGREATLEEFKQSELLLAIRDLIIGN